MKKSRDMGWMKRIKWAVGLICFLALGLLLYRTFGLLTPEKVRDRTIRAFQQRDAAALCSLADPKELDRLHITPQVVKAWLDELVPGKRLNTRAVSLLRAMPTDQRAYLVEWDNPPQGWKPLGIEMVDHPDKGWRIVLSGMLYGLSWSRHDAAEGFNEYIRLARKHGVTGKRSPSGNGYVSLEYLEQIMASH